MTLLSISIGLVFFVAAIAWMLFVATYDPNGSPAFGFVLIFFPMTLGLLLIVPNTLYRAIFVVKNKPEQTKKEKLILAAGIVVTIFFIGSFIRLAFT